MAAVMRTPWFVSKQDYWRMTHMDGADKSRIAPVHWYSDVLALGAMAGSIHASIIDAMTA